MKYDYPSDSEISDINVTPFVDVLLVLLIIFMITAPVITFNIPVDLPSEKKSASATETKTADVIITVMQDNKIFVDSIPVARDKLETELKKKTESASAVNIFMQADKNAKYGYVAELMAFLRNKGFVNLNLVIKNSE